MKIVHLVSLILLLIGGLHLGLSGLLGLDLLGAVLGGGVILKLVLILIGVSSLLHLRQVIPVRE